MMHFDVYCDESRPDLLSSTRPGATYMVLGSLWLRAADRQPFKDAIHAIRNRHRVGGEFKWQKVTPSRLEFYEELVSWFCRQGTTLRFRCVAVDPKKVDLQLYHDADQELGFYKFYYQLLHHWILDFNKYSIFLDFKSNRKKDRLPVLQRCLSRANLSSLVDSVQAVRSEESVLIQLADVLTGTAASRLNETLRRGSAKECVVAQLEHDLGNGIRATGRDEQKFNVFVMDLHGGW